MTFKDFKIKNSYISKGNDNISDSFLNPILGVTKEYKRSVGFFSSSVLETLMEGVMGLVNNGGHIKIIASPELSEEDVSVINQAYNDKRGALFGIASEQLRIELEKLNENRLMLLYELITKDFLDIKIAVTEDVGIYHDKLGILTDTRGNKVVFYGSSNETYSGYIQNYEKIRIAKSWELGFKDIVEEEEKEFDDLWDGKNNFLQIYPFNEVVAKNIITVIEKKKSNVETNKSDIVLRDYQINAINAWVNNGYNGFYIMATGTGKTWTAIYSALELLKQRSCIIVICAPYIHLLKQWADDLEKVFTDSRIIMVSSENPNWSKQISDEIIAKKYNSNRKIVIVSTIKSFRTQKFNDVISKSSDEKLLIVDEAHRFTDRSDDLHSIYKYMLGLSATPFSGKSASKGIELMNFFGGQVFNLPIEEALERGYLVQYNYYPIYVNATDDEQVRFNNYTRQILSCFRNGVCINKDLLVRAVRNRLRVISMAEEKYTRIDYILNHIKHRDHFVVYCGDGKLFDNNTGEEIRHIQAIKRKLSEHDYRSSQFTAQENMNERMQLVEAFNNGEISALAAIRCLDEGINIPSIKSALILSSNDDYREFVQRRGRILRTFKGKNVANIYDVIVLPNNELQSWAGIELRRFKEFGRLARNWEVLQDEYNQLLGEYGLTDDDVSVYDYEDMEDYSDD